MSPVRRLLTVASACFIAIACAPHTSGSTPSGQHNVLTAEELARVGDIDLYEAIRRLRPGFLRSHGGQGVLSGRPDLQLYVGDVRLPDLDQLRNISVRSVKEVRFLEPQQANARFGGNNSGGAIVVTLM